MHDGQTDLIKVSGALSVPTKPQRRPSLQPPKKTGPPPKRPRTPRPSKKQKESNTYQSLVPLQGLTKSGNFESISTVPKVRTHSQLKTAWNHKRVQRLKDRLDHHRKRAILKRVPSEEVTTVDLINRYMFFQNKCAYCQHPGRKLQMDHFIPISRGGGHVLKNLVPCCRSCNLSKGCALPFEWYAKQSFHSSTRVKMIRQAINTRTPYTCSSVLPGIE